MFADAVSNKFIPAACSGHVMTSSYDNKAKWTLLKFWMQPLFFTWQDAGQPENFLAGSLESRFFLTKINYFLFVGHLMMLSASRLCSVEW
jgi:hypothetical protein